MKKTEELIVITKTYDLALWIINHTSRFPRQHRHVLGDRIERPFAVLAPAELASVERRLGTYTTASTA